MLAIQKKYAGYLREFEKSLGEEKFDHDQSLLERVQGTELVMPVVGAFSAGKSSLLNEMLGSEVLPVGIAPETELATELRYSSEPRLMAVRPDGSEQAFPVEALRANEWRGTEFSHLRLYHDSESLRLMEPFVLVDMPGYGSSLEKHNQAIAYYLPRGVHFIVVTSVEEGTLSQSVQRNMEELERYGTGFSCVLSKCNLRTASQVEEVQSHIDEQLALYFNDTIKTLPIAQGEGAKFVAAVDALDANAIFNRLFLDILKDQSCDLLDQINLSLSTLNKSDEENEHATKALEQALEGLLAKREDMTEQVRTRYSERLVDRAIKNVDEALHDALEELVGYAQSSDPSRYLGNAVAEIVRSSLTQSMRLEIKRVSDEIINQISKQLPDLDTQALAFGDNTWSQDLTDKVKLGLQHGSATLGEWSGRLNEHLQAKQQMPEARNRQLYKTVATTLAVATAIVNPLIELAIIFLPDILAFMSQGNAQQKARQQLRDKLLNDVFPRVESRLRQELPAMVQEQLTAALQEINRQFEGQIEKQKSLVEAGQQEKQAKAESVAERVQALTALFQRIQSLAQDYLYA